MILNGLRSQEKNSFWFIMRDIGLLLILLTSSVYVVYFNSQNIARVYFLFLLFLFIFTKKDYVWFAYFFIIAQGPGYFFSDLAASSQYRLPFYTFSAGFSFTPIDIFVVVAFLKALIIGRKREFKLKLPLIALLAYTIFSLSLVSVISGTSIDIVAWNLRWLFFYSIIISFSYLVYEKEEIYRFILLIFPLVFFIFFTQIYFVSTGSEFINHFDPGYRDITLNIFTGTIRPYVGGVLVVFFSFIFSMYLLVNEDVKLSKIYLYFIVVVAFLSIFVSSTRQWFVYFSLIFAGYVIASKKKIFSLLGIITVILIVLGTITYFDIIPLDKLIQSPWVRVRQVFNLATGDVYTVDTAMNRFVNQLPVIMAVIKQNPLIGYGFSNISMSYYDNDLGFVNTILMFGIIGFSLFIFFFVKIFVMLVSTVKTISFNNPFRAPLKIIVFGWASILLGYLTTWDYFTFYFYKVFFISILLALTEFFVAQASKEDLIAAQKTLLLQY
jgi:hypothetical protein